MPYITKNNYHIGFGERFIRVFSDVYNQSWHSEYIADLTACFKKLIIREAEGISFDIAIKLKNDSDSSEHNNKHGEVYNDLVHIIELTGFSGRRRSMSYISKDSRNNFINNMICEEAELIGKDNDESHKISEDIAADGLSNFQYFSSITIDNAYCSEMDGSFILQKDLIEARLKELSETPYTKIPFAAMCYSISPAIIRYTDYVCPKCRVLSSCNEDDIKALERIRRIVLEFNDVGYDVLLKEPEYCESCLKKEVNEDQYYIFQIRFSPEENYHTVKTNDLYDFVCLQAFLMGGVGYHAKREDEMLHDKIDTINKMTGLGADTVAKWLKTHVKSNIGMFDGW